MTDYYRPSLKASAKPWPVFFYAQKTIRCPGWLDSGLLTFALIMAQVPLRLSGSGHDGWGRGGRGDRDGRRGGEGYGDGRDDAGAAADNDSRGGCNHGSEDTPPPAAPGGRREPEDIPPPAAETLLPAEDAPQPAEEDAPLPAQDTPPEVAAEDWPPPRVGAAKHAATCQQLTPSPRKTYGPAPELCCKQQPKPLR